jgi:hypothetical protein
MEREKIVFAIQDWSTRYGWWHPNTVPLDFVVNGVKMWPATHGIQYFNIARGLHAYSSNETLFNNTACKYDYFSGSPSMVEYKALSAIPLEQKYIYPVFVRNVGYFQQHENIKFNCVSERVLNDVKNNLAKIVIIHSVEGQSGRKWGQDYIRDDFEVLNDWCVDKNLKKDQVYFIHGNHRITDKFARYNFTYVDVDAFPHWLQTVQQDILPYTPVNGQNLFLCYNRRADYHRLRFILELIKTGLLYRGLVSYSGKTYSNNKKNSYETLKEYNWGWKQNDSDIVHLSEAANELDKVLPLTLDFADLMNSNPVAFINPDHHTSTFLSIVNETDTNSEIVFFSEKTWKPILAGQPFMFIAGPNYLEELKKQGYQTFDKWWSEDYDKEAKLEKRIEIVIDNLLQLSRLNDEQLIDLRKQIEPVLQHNLQLFNNKKNTEKNVFNGIPGTHLSDSYLYIPVKKIWDSF